MMIPGIQGTGKIPEDFIKGVASFILDVVGAGCQNDRNDIQEDAKALKVQMWRIKAWVFCKDGSSFTNVLAKDGQQGAQGKDDAPREKHEVAMGDPKGPAQLSKIGGMTRSKVVGKN
jgi:hypothetical protein